MEVYENMGELIVNKVRCKKCGDIIESKYRYNMVWCKCKSIAVDGGHEYQRLTWAEGKMEDFIDTSYSEYSNK